MTIRSRLLVLLLPSLIAFLILLYSFCYFNYSREILNSFMASLSIVSETSQKPPTDEIEWLFLIAGSIMTLLLATMTVFLIAERISKPVRELNRAALKIAAGDYETNIEVKGPKEIVELAHTLNTMSECLVEHISRLRESSLIRERMYGEYECAILLQYHMLQKVVENFSHQTLRMLLISVPHSSLQKGLFLKIEYPSLTEIALTLIEASEYGFPGLFQLNQSAHLPIEELKNKGFINCRFDRIEHGNQILRWISHDLFPPLVWCKKSQQFIKGSYQEIHLQNGDMIFLYNSSLVQEFKTEAAIEAWFSRVLRHFSEDGLETIQTMLTNELTFLAKKQNAKFNYYILCIQIQAPFTN